MTLLLFHAKIEGQPSPYAFFLDPRVSLGDVTAHGRVQE